MPSLLPPRPPVIDGLSGVRGGIRREDDTKRCVCIEVPKYIDGSSNTLTDSRNVDGDAEAVEFCSKEASSVLSG